MPHSPQTETRIRSWVSSLADVTTSGPQPVSAERVASIAGLLLKDPFPGAAYTSDSLKHVATGHDWFPSYSQIAAALEVWWSENRPRLSPALPDESASSGAHLAGEDRHWFDYWHKRKGEGFAALPGSSMSGPGHVTSLVRSKSPAAWAAISGQADRGDLVPRAPTQEVVEAVARLLHPEPQPPAALDTRPGPVPAPFPDVSMTGEALRKSRAARGLTVPPDPDASPGFDGDPPRDASAWH